MITSECRLASPLDSQPRPGSIIYLSPLTRNRTYDGKLRFPEVYNDDFFTRASGLLDEADRQLANAPEVYRRRLAHVRSGLPFPKAVIEVRTLKDRYEARGTPQREVNYSAARVGCQLSLQNQPAIIESNQPLL